MDIVPTEGRQQLPWCVPLTYSLVGASTKEHDKVQLMRTSVIIAMVMLLKAHLKTLYSLSEEWVDHLFIFSNLLFVNYSSKCNKFAIGKKSAIGDKTATRRHEHPISWNRLPFATTPLLTSADADVQKTRVRKSFLSSNIWDNKWL